MMVRENQEDHQLGWPGLVICIMESGSVCDEKQFDLGY